MLYSSEKNFERYAMLLLGLFVANCHKCFVVPVVVVVVAGVVVLVAPCSFVKSALCSA